MEKLFLPEGKVYILSGVPGSGKSTLLKNINIDKSSIISLDELRENILGTQKTNINEHYKESLFTSLSLDEAVTNIALSILNERCVEKLTTFIDATSINDSARAKWINIANKNNTPYEILILDRDPTLNIENDKKRRFTVGESVINKFASGFQKDSIHPYKLVSPDTKSIVVLPNYIDTKYAYDVIGDIHGLYDDFVALIKNQGYRIEDNKIIHNSNRKLIILGDFVDRGVDSIKLWSLFENNKNDGHVFLLGNHEQKVLRGYISYKNNSIDFEPNSPASRETLSNLLKEDDATQNRLIDFLQKLPVKAVFKKQIKYASGFNKTLKLAFAHADIINFDPLNTPKSALIYGANKMRGHNVDSDYLYTHNKLNQFILFRGHIPGTSQQEKVFSLENEAWLSGNLTLLPLDQFIEKTISFNGDFRRAFTTSVVNKKTNFNFNDYKQKFNLKYELDKLILDTKKKSDVVKVVDESRLLSIYKYSKSVFYNQKWHIPNINKARGIVFDLAGNIVQHPFDKIFNYNENNSGSNLKDDDLVEYIEKLNGFLGCITKHPYKNDLLITTTGSFDSPYVSYIKEFITPSLKNDLLNFFVDHDVTLMFEVIHKDDPHIIKYADSDSGLHLIGARYKNIKDTELSEDIVDVFAKKLKLRRPIHGICSFYDLKEMVKKTTGEGYMVRNINNNNFIMKYKSPYYLSNKLLARLTPNNVKFMYSKKELFKQEKMDEEFFYLVDIIVDTISQDDFLSMSDQNRIDFIKNIMNNNNYFPDNNPTL